EVFLDGAVALALTVPQVMALVYQYQPIPAQIEAFLCDTAEREYARAQAILSPIVLPHRDHILGTADERLQVVIVLEDTCYRSGHERLAKANHVSNEHTTPLVEVMRGNLDRGNLKVKELIAKVVWEVKLADSSARFL